MLLQKQMLIWQLLKVAWHFCLKIRNIPHQKIQEFEHRMFEIVHEIFLYPLQHWIRCSYECGVQFRSGYTVVDLLHGSESNQMKSASFTFFKSHDGKTCSDSIRSIVKCSFTRPNWWITWIKMKKKMRRI